MELLRHADQDDDGFLDYRDFAAEFSSTEDSDAILARAGRVIARRRKAAAAAAARSRASGGLGGLEQHMIDTVRRTSSVAQTLQAAGAQNEEALAAQFDWRRLASLGTWFLTSGGYAQVGQF